MRVSYFLMRNPAMKFQNSILDFERMDGQTEGRQTSPKQYAP